LILELTISAKREKIPITFTSVVFNLIGLLLLLQYACQLYKT